MVNLFQKLSLLFSLSVSLFSLSLFLCRAITEPILVFASKTMQRFGTNFARCSCSLYRTRSAVRFRARYRAPKFIIFPLIKNKLLLNALVFLISPSTVPCITLITAIHLGFQNFNRHEITTKYTTSRRACALIAF